MWLQDKSNDALIRLKLSILQIFHIFCHIKNDRKNFLKCFYTRSKKFFKTINFTEIILFLDLLRLGKTVPSDIWRSVQPLFSQYLGQELGSKWFPL